jgi:hypothetical protein
MEAKQVYQEKLVRAIEEASKRLLERKLSGRGRPNNDYSDIRRAVEEMYELEEKALDSYKSAIRKRVFRKNPSGIGESSRTPMASAEPTIVAYCIKCSQIGQPLTHDQVRELAISLVEDTALEAAVVNWKKKILPPSRRSTSPRQGLVRCLHEEAC